MKGLYINGIYPDNILRENRSKEIEKQLRTLVEMRENLNKQINQLVIESNILRNMNQLEEYIEGKIDLQVEQPKE